MDEQTIRVQMVRQFDLISCPDPFSLCTIEQWSVHETTFYHSYVFMFYSGTTVRTENLVLVSCVRTLGEQMDFSSSMTQRARYVDEENTE